MNAPSKSMSILLLVLAIVAGFGSMLACAIVPLGTLRLIRPDWTDGIVLLWNAGLSLVFFLQHSGMTRPKVRALLGKIIAPVYVPAIYAIASGIALGLVVFLWQPSQTHLYSFTGASRVAAHAVTLAAAGLFAWGMYTLKAFDPLGLRPLTGRASPADPKHGEFAARGAYGLVRHPLYLALLVMIWATPDMSTDRLLFDVMWTVWMVVGTMLEEADLVAECGESYRSYQRIVPMLIPWTKPRSALRAAEEQS
jgi:methanethiol S-methyltransferase